MAKPTLSLGERIRTGITLGSLAAALILKGDKSQKAIEVGEKVGTISEAIANLIAARNRQ